MASLSSEAAVSAHASVNATGDSLTLFLLNRATAASRDVRVTLANFAVPDGTYRTLTLNDLPGTETFQSHTRNALAEGVATLQSGSLSLTLPSLSVTAVLLTGQTTVSAEADIPRGQGVALGIYPNPFRGQATLSYTLPQATAVRVDVYDLQGRHVRTLRDAWTAMGTHTETLQGAGLPGGLYVVRLRTGREETRRLVTLVR